MKEKTKKEKKEAKKELKECQNLILILQQSELH